MRVVLECRLPASARSVRQARNAAREAVQSFADAELGGNVALVTSELVTNAIVHAGTACDLRLLMDSNGGRVVVRLEVTDGGPGEARQREPSTGEPGGRGLRLVDQLATRWGSAPTSDGKQVFVELTA